MNLSEIWIGSGVRRMAAAASATATGSSTIDPKAFYGYLFEVDKKPTRTLDALLRGIAGYIVSALRRIDYEWMSEGKAWADGVTER